MKIVLDTNVLLVCISDRSSHYWIWQNILKGNLQLCVTTDILHEYAEIIQRYMGENASNLILDAIINLPSLELTTKYFFWQLIESDIDDNKFVDCAIAASAKYLVTEDKHFNILKKIPFPKVEVVNIQELKSILNS